MKGNTKTQVNETGEVVNEKVSCKKFGLLIELLLIISSTQYL